MTFERFREAAFAAMGEQRISMKVLAGRMGVSRQWLHRVLVKEGKHGCTDKTIDSVCRALRIDVGFTKDVRS